MRGAFERAKILISLEPGRLTVSALRGGVIERSAVEYLSASDWVGHWDQGLRTLHEPLEQALVRVRAAPGDRAVILFESPRTSSELMEVPARGNEAVSAARLAISDRMQIAADSPCIAVRPLGEVTDSGGGRRSQLIVVASEESVVQRLTELAERYALRVVAMVPSGGALLSVLADYLESQRDRNEAARVFLIERHRTVVGSLLDGRIQVLRTFEVGVHHIVEALVKASQSTDGGRSVSMTPDRAWAILKDQGVPNSGQEFPAYEELDPRSVMPLLQPALQRLYVELRQSFRLSGRHFNGSGVVLRMGGAGCAIPGLSTAIADALNVEVVSIHDSNADSMVTEILESKHAANLRLTSHAVLQSQINARVRKASLVGACLGIGLLGLQVAWTSMEIRSLDAALSDGESDLLLCEQFALMSLDAAKTREHLIKANQIVERYGASQPDWRAVLTEVALACASRVELIELRGSIEDREAVVTVSGVAEAGNEGAHLNEFIQVLMSSPLVRNVHVVSRRLVEFDDRESHQFRLRIVLEPLDFLRLHAEVEP